MSARAFARHVAYGLALLAVAIPSRSTAECRARWERLCEGPDGVAAIVAQVVAVTPEGAPNGYADRVEFLIVSVHGDGAQPTESNFTRLTPSSQYAVGDEVLLGGDANFDGTIAIKSGPFSIEGNAVRCGEGHLSLTLAQELITAQDCFSRGTRELGRCREESTDGAGCGAAATTPTTLAVLVALAALSLTAFGRRTRAKSACRQAVGDS